MATSPFLCLKRIQRESPFVWQPPLAHSEYNIERESTSNMANVMNRAPTRIVYEGKALGSLYIVQGVPRYNVYACFCRQITTSGVAPAAWDIVLLVPPPPQGVRYGRNAKKFRPIQPTKKQTSLVQCLIQQNTEHRCFF